jgi:hypothetical protein
MSSFIIIQIYQLTQQIGAFTLSHQQLNSSMTYKKNPMGWENWPPPSRARQCRAGLSSYLIKLGKEGDRIE